MFKIVTIKNWFLLKNGKFASNNNDLRNGYRFNEYSNFQVIRETEKAVLINANGETWVPKSALRTVTESELDIHQIKNSDEWVKGYFENKDLTKEELNQKFEEAKAKFIEASKGLEFEEIFEIEEYKEMEAIRRMMI